MTKVFEQSNLILDMKNDSQFKYDAGVERCIKSLEEIADDLQDLTFEDQEGTSGVWSTIFGILEQDLLLAKLNYVRADQMLKYNCESFSIKTKDNHSISG